MQSKEEVENASNVEKVFAEKKNSYIFTPEVHAHCTGNIFTGNGEKMYMKRHYINDAHTLHS